MISFLFLNRLTSQEAVSLYATKKKNHIKIKYFIPKAKHSAEVPFNDGNYHENLSFQIIDEHLRFLFT